MQEREQIKKWMRNPESLNEESCELLLSLCKQYPSFQLLHFLLLKNLRILDKQEDYSAKLPYVALFCGDRRKLFYHMFDKEYGIYNVYWDDEKNVVEQQNEKFERTDALLDAFLKESEENSKEKEVALNPDSLLISRDYFSAIPDEQTESKVSEKSDQNSELKHQDIIDDFIKHAEENKIRLTAKPDASTSDGNKISNFEYDKGDPFLTKTLAEIYIKQGKYQQALGIIKQLNLNFPKKNRYFADQYRFLNLLIENDKKK